MGMKVLFAPLLLLSGICSDAHTYLVLNDQHNEESLIPIFSRANSSSVERWGGGDFEFVKSANLNG